MTVEGHLLFSISCAIFAKNIELTPTLAQGDWWHIISSAILTCLLPDIDHPKSFLGQRLRWISIPISKIFGHRGFTHSLLIVFIILTLFYFKASKSIIVQPDYIQGMVIGYISHIFADMLTPAGVPLLWPSRWRFSLPILVTRKNNQLERIFCITLFVLVILLSHSILHKKLINLLLKTINSLQIYLTY